MQLKTLKIDMCFHNGGWRDKIEHAMLSLNNCTVGVVKRALYAAVMLFKLPYSSTHNLQHAINCCSGPPFD